MTSFTHMSIALHKLSYQVNTLVSYRKSPLPVKFPLSEEILFHKYILCAMDIHPCLKYLRPCDTMTSL